MKTALPTVAAVLALCTGAAFAQSKAPPQGVGKDEIVVGSIQDLSGPIAGFGSFALDPKGRIQFSPKPNVGGAVLSVHCRSCGRGLNDAAERKLGRHTDCPATFDEAITVFDMWAEARLGDPEWSALEAEFAARRAATTPTRV